MEQHPVPQQISSYQFRLVGDMTLKQFFQLAGGALIALLFYASPLPALFKWPLVALFALTGAAFAFLPLEERPLEIWVAAFFRSIYTPTLFYWKKIDPNHKYFTDDPVVNANPTGAQPLANQKTVPTNPVTHQSGSESKLENLEHDFMSRITHLIKNTPTTTQKTAPTASAQILTQQVEEQQKPTPITVEQRVVEIPTNTPKPVEKTNMPVYSSTAVTPTTNIPLPQAQTTQVAQVLSGSNQAPAAPVQYSEEATPPSPPTAPNIIVGQVIDITGKIVEGAILEVRDEQGRPVRALKTNKAGHFLIVTPLSSGKYQLATEKPGLVFEPLTFEAKGQIIPSLIVRANQ